MLQYHSGRFGDSVAAAGAEQRIRNPQGNHQVRPPAEEVPLLLVKKHRHGRPGQRIDPGLPEEGPGIAAAVQEEEGSDAAGGVRAVRAVTDDGQAVREEGGDGRPGRGSGGILRGEGHISRVRRFLRAEIVIDDVHRSGRRRRSLRIVREGPDQGGGFRGGGWDLQAGAYGMENYCVKVRHSNLPELRCPLLRQT